MKRRSFFGLALGAAVAGPSVAQEAMGQVLQGPGLNVPFVGGSWAKDGGLFDQAAYVAERLSDVKKQLATFDDESEAGRRKAIEGMQVQYLDPDIDCMRSLSGVTKLRMQRTREYDRQRRRERGWLTEQFERLLRGEPA